METFLYTIFFFSCVVLIGAVLLQPGKANAGALFTSGISSAAMNPRGTASVLSKLTIVAATVFMVSALMLSMPAITGNISVLKTQGESAAPKSTIADSDKTGEAKPTEPATSDDKKGTDEGTAAPDVTPKDGGMSDPPGDTGNDDKK